MTVKEYIDKMKKADSKLHNAEGLSFFEEMATQTWIWNNTACKGYAAAAASAAGFSDKEIGKLLEAMSAAFENMTIEEAEKYYNFDRFKE